MPSRVQLSRKRGWRKPEGSVVVTRVSKWGNPYKVVECPGGWWVEVIDPRLPLVGAVYPTKQEALNAAVGFHRSSLLNGELKVTVDDVRRELAGRDLCCSCALDQSCHADTLLESAGG